MNKQDLIKLAEVAELEIRVANENLIWIQEDGHDSVPWEPHENIAQAFEVLEGWRLEDDLRHYMISSPKQHTCIEVYELDLYCYDSEGFLHEVVNGQHEVLSQAIFQAVLRANEAGK